MNIESILTPERTFANLESTSKKRLLEKASGVLAGAEPGISEQHLYSKLIAREKIGPTAIGNGIAIPHCRVECSKTFAALFKLSRGIDFGAIDEVPVRIVFVLIAPQNEANIHLEILAMLASRFASPVFFEAVLGAENDKDLYETAILNLDERLEPRIAG